MHNRGLMYSGMRKYFIFQYFFQCWELKPKGLAHGKPLLYYLTIPPVLSFILLVHLNWWYYQYTLQLMVKEIRFSWSRQEVAGRQRPREGGMRVASQMMQSKGSLFHATVKNSLYGSFFWCHGVREGFRSQLSTP